MNIDNLNKLIAHLEAQPPERINMGWYNVMYRHECGTAGCIGGHIKAISGYTISSWLYVSQSITDQLAFPDEWAREKTGVRRYPAHRVIATLKRLRDTYLSTGQVVVDWGPEPGEEPKQVWAAPQVAEVINPALPNEITRLLRTRVEA